MVKKKTQVIVDFKTDPMIFEIDPNIFLNELLNGSRKNNGGKNNK